MGDVEALIRRIDARLTLLERQRERSAWLTRLMRDERNEEAERASQPEDPAAAHASATDPGADRRA